MTLDLQKLRHDLDLMKKSEEAVVNKMERIQKENHILQITLQQRDDEIARQQEIVEYVFKLPIFSRFSNCHFSEALNQQ